MLPAHYWNVIRLRYLEDMTFGELADSGRQGNRTNDTFSVSVMM